jgi:hypothetical protein
MLRRGQRPGDQRPEKSTVSVMRRRWFDWLLDALERVVEHECPLGDRGHFFVGLGALTRRLLTLAL